MPQLKEWKQLNNLPETSTYIKFPIAFTGKKAPAFARLTLSCQFILAAIYSMNNLFKEPTKITYDYFIKTFGISSRETISAGLQTLTERGIIKSEKRSHYTIIAKFRKSDYVEIDTYWLKHEWGVSGKNKRLSRSRLLTLALLKRGCENPETSGEFNSSQKRIGVALNLPKSTAGDSVRELVAAGLIQYVQSDVNKSLKLFAVNPGIMEVKHPARKNLEEMKEYIKHRADELHKRFMLDTEYRSLFERINRNASAKIKEIVQNFGEVTAELVRLETETEQLRAELDVYLKAHKVKREVFPPGFFKCDITENNVN
ncbi:MAG: MarR family transcriptional regulator [Lactobacillus sp.]|nr:MarR family transcriptional regulator [Lactobacillus sp.]